MLAEGSVVFDDLKERVVTESGRAGRRRLDSAAAIGLAVGTHIALRIGKRDVTDVVGRSFLKRQIA